MSESGREDRALTSIPCGCGEYAVRAPEGDAPVSLDAVCPECGNHFGYGPAPGDEPATEEEWSDGSPRPAMGDGQPTHARLEAVEQRLRRAEADAQTARADTKDTTTSETIVSRVCRLESRAEAFDDRLDAVEMLLAGEGLAPAGGVEGDE